ncbi:MAG: FkbM family methyltransferase [Thiogranum sp.]
MSYAGKVLKTLRARKHLEAGSYVAEFPDEGGQSVIFPRVSLMDCLFRYSWEGVRNSRIFLTRAMHEVLFRKIVYLLYTNGIISRNRSVVDIGAWIGDNALIWAGFLEGEAASVIAVDPSPSNIAYLEGLARFNRVDNIVPVVAVCSDEEGRELVYEGDIDHTAFADTARNARGKLSSTTIDAIIRGAGDIDVGFFHIDVEGMEKDVLTGSFEMIRKSLPVICFEQHIESDPVGEILAMLDGQGYSSYMLNEALPDCNLDCRNILSFPPTVDAGDVTRITESVETKNPYFRLIPGGPLIPLNAGA